MHDSIYAEFERRFVEGMKALKVGDPMDLATDVGPLATAQIAGELDDQVQRAVAGGARLLTGGKRINWPGNFYEADRARRIFPRAAPCITKRFSGRWRCCSARADIDEAIEIANDSDFGLASSVWTNDEAERARFIAEIEAGAVFVNGMVASDPRLPFGGVKNSGYGRELSDFGIREFCNIKTVWIK